MASRIYIMPVYDTLGWRVPKYCFIPDELTINPNSILSFNDGTDFTMMQFGFDQFCITSINCTDGEHVSISSNIDAYQFPVNLDTTMTTPLVNVASAFLENLGFPADWLTTSTTYRAALRKLVELCQVAQEFKDRFGAGVYTDGTDLSTRGSQMSIAKKSAMEVMKASRGNPSSIADNETMRDVLNELTTNYVNFEGNPMGAVTLGDEIV